MIQLPSIYTFISIEDFPYDHNLKPHTFPSQSNILHLNNKETFFHDQSPELGFNPSLKNYSFQFKKPSLFKNDQIQNSKEKLFKEQSSFVNNLQKNQLIQLLKWISGSFPLTAQYFFQLHHSYFNSIFPISKRELGRLRHEKLVQFIDSFQEAIKSIMKIEDIFTLLEFTFRSYKKSNMKNIRKINLETFYSVGFRSFFPSHEPFENMLKEMKEY